MAIKETEQEGRQKVAKVNAIINETKLVIVHEILEDIYNYDGRFDVPHIIHLEDIIQKVLSAKVSCQFISDMAEVKSR